jgi:hypothetical protein
MKEHSSKQMKNTNSRRLILAALVFGAVLNAFAIIVRTVFFWETPRLLRFFFLLAGILVATAMYLWTYNYIEKLSTSLKNKIIVSILAILYCIYCFSFIWFVNLPDSMNGLWLGGYGMQLIKIVDFIFRIIDVLLIIVLCIFSYRLLCSALSTQKRRNLIDSLFLCLFFIICLVPLKGIPSFSTIETDFWGRDASIKVYQTLRQKIGDRYFQKTILSKEDWLIYTDEISIQDFQNTLPLTDGQLEQIYSNLEYLNDFLQSKGITLMVVIPPNKNTIYPENMPEEIPIIGATSRLDQVIAYQNEHHGVEILDLRQVFLEAKKDNQVYLATDSHWNLYGAFLAYQEILNKLHEKFPDLEPYSVDNFKFLPAGKGSGDLSGIAKIKVYEDYYKLEYKGLDDIKINQVKYYFSNDKSKQIPLDIYYNNDESLPDLYVYHDSFGNALKNYLPLNFHRTIFLRQLYNDLEFDQIESENPNIVLIEFTERYLSFLITKIPTP